LVTGTWLAAQARKNVAGEWIIAVDGKVMRGAWTDENGKVTLFSAMLHREAVTMAQVRVPDGTNEITQAETLLVLTLAVADAQWQAHQPPRSGRPGTR
jgi:hypothetical protein